NWAAYATACRRLYLAGVRLSSSPASPESEKPRSWTSFNTGLSPTSLEFESRADNVWRDMAARRLTTPCSNHWVSCAVDQQEMNLSISWRNKRLRYWYSSLHL